MSTQFTLPPLPYAYDALGPYMSAETLEFHHDKHHQAYVTNGEKLLEGSGLENASLEEIVQGSFGKNQGLFNNAGQHYNHVHFWQWMKPNGGGNKLPGALQSKIDEDLGGFDKFRADFINAGTTQFGSGWAWLSLKDGKLEAVAEEPEAEDSGADVIDLTELLRRSLGGKKDKAKEAPKSKSSGRSTTRRSPAASRTRKAK